MVRDLALSKDKAEFLASCMKEMCVFKEVVHITHSRKMNQTLTSYFSVEVSLCFFATTLMNYSVAYPKSMLLLYGAYSQTDLKEVSKLSCCMMETRNLHSYMIFSAHT